MEEKQDTIYLSSKEALVKIFVLMLTIGISILASLLDYKSCYVTILIQACNNMYDFYHFTDNKKYTTTVQKESITVIFFSIISIIISVVALLNVYAFLKPIWIKLIVVLFISIPLIIIYSDYKINIIKENERK